MHDFDRFLDAWLRQMLDPVVASRPPARMRHGETTAPGISPVAEAPAREPAPVVELGVVVNLPVAPAPSL